MSDKLLSVEVKGKEKTWGFMFYGDPKYIPEWEADGLKIVEVLNVIPAWVVDWGLVKPYCFLQDLWNFSLFKK